MADAGATGGPVLLSAVTAAVSLGAGVAPPACSASPPPPYSPSPFPRLKHRRNY